MSTTFKCVILPHHRKNDGTTPVKIRITHNRVVKYLPTDIFVDDSALSKNGDIRDLRIADRLNDIAKEYRELLLQVRGAESMDINQLIKALEQAKEKDNFRLDFFDFADQYIAKIKTRTSEIYRTSVNALKRFVGSDRLDINDITSNFIARFTDFLENEPQVTNGNQTYKKKDKGCRAISLYLSNIRALHNAAREQYNDEDTGYMPIPRQPFRKRGTVPPQPQTKHRNISADQIRKLMAAEPKTKLEEMAKDVFFISFMLCGMNTVDIYTLEQNCVEGGILTYNRHKTATRRADHAFTQMRIEPELAPLLEKYRADNDSIFYLDFSTRYSTTENFCRYVNKGLKRLLPELGGEITTYFTRHSWATIATNECGVPFDIVHQALVHSRSKEDKVTEIYIKKDFTPIWEANRKVIDFVFGK